MLTWERLRIFAALAEHGSVTAAADALHLTRPAVSQHLRKLERETRCQLVEPDGRGIRLTTAGEILARSAGSVAGTIADVEHDLAAIGGQVVGTLRVGAVASVLRALLPQVLHTLGTEHPRLEPTLVDGEVVEMIPELRARRLDVVIAESWPHRPAHMPAGVGWTEVHREDVHLAVSQQHPLADRSSIRLDELNHQRWASCPPGAEDYEALVQTLRAHNLESEIPYLVSDTATKLALVAGNLAVALVPTLGRVPCPPGVRFVPCEPAMHRSIGAVTRAGRATPAQQVFVDELLRVTQAADGPAC